MLIFVILFDHSYKFEPVLEYNFDYIFCFLICFRRYKPSLLFLVLSYFHRFNVVITNNGHAVLSDIVVSDPSAVSGAPTNGSFVSPTETPPTL